MSKEPSGFSSLRHLGGDFFRFLRQPGEQRDLWGDYLDFKREAQFIRDHQFPKPEGERTVLVTSMTTWVYQLKVEGMLALGLRLNGWTVKLLMRSQKDRWSHRYFRAMGFTDFVYWGDFQLTDAEKSECQHDAEEFLAKPMTFRGVKEWNYRGSWIGPQILSSVSRGMREGAPDVTDPKVQQQIKELLPRALEVVRRAEKVMTMHHPQLMYLMEANYAQNGPLTDVAVQRGVSVVQVVQIARDDAMTFRRLNKQTRRDMPASITKDMFQQLQREPWSDRFESELAQVYDARTSGKWFLQARNSPGVEQAGRDEIFDRLKLDKSKKVAIVFSHILWDANLFFGEDLFEDYGDWFVQTVRAATQNDKVNWLIKLHPANIWKRQREQVDDELSEVGLIRRSIGELPPHVQLLYPDFKINNKSLFSIVDWSITVRGTVSTESSCLGIPVFTAGTGRCHGLGFTIDSRTKEEYLERMANIQSQPRLTDAQVLLAKRYAHAVFCRRPWIMKTFKAAFFKPPEGRHVLDHNLNLQARSMEEIRANGDLDRWAKWAQTDLVDYMEY